MPELRTSFSPTPETSAWVIRIVDQAPPLTPEQILRCRAVFADARVSVAPAAPVAA